MITFSSSKVNNNSSSTVNKLLDSVLPGHTTASALKHQPLSSSQIINSAQKRTKPEEIRRLRKKEKLIRRNASKLQRDSMLKVDSQARYDVLQQHAKQGTLTAEEKKELKRLVKKNVVNIQSWRVDSEQQGDLKEVQQEIIQLQKGDYSRTKRRAPKSNKLELGQLYKKKQEKKFPGLTPGLAPVGMSDSEDSDDEE